MFRQQQQFRHQSQAEVHQKTSSSASTSAPTWETWLACVCRGRLVLKLILGTTVLLLAVNLWPGPQLLPPDDHGNYNQLKPIAGEGRKFVEKQMVSPSSENQLMSPPTESQKTSGIVTKLVKSTSTKDSQKTVNNIKKEAKILQSVKDSLKYANYDGERYSHLRHFEMEHGDIDDVAHVSIPLKKQPLMNVLPKVSIFPRPSPSVVTNPAVVFLYSSSTRSGSTVFGEMVATKSNSILMYEPFKPFLQTNCLKNSSCVHDVLSTSINCNFKTSKLAQHFKYFFIRTSHHDVERCKGKNRQVVKHCLRKLDIVDLCKKTPIRILKLVRGKLSDLEVFLNDPKINAKIIHVTRDPRGTIQSVKSLGWLGNTTLSSKCKHIYNDLVMFDHLHKKYIDKIATFSIEDFSIDPTRIAEEVFRFLFQEGELSINTEHFITTHMSGVSKPGPYNTHKDSQQEFQSWRNEIGLKLLQKVELEEPCQQAIAKLGHNLFGDIETARNLSISLFDDSYLYT